MIHMPKKLFVCVNLIIILTACSGGSSESDSPIEQPSGDTTPPIITIIGPQTAYHEVGTEYEDPGATYFDDSGETKATD